MEIWYHSTFFFLRDQGENEVTSQNHISVTFLLCAVCQHRVCVVSVDDVSDGLV